MLVSLLQGASSSSSHLNTNNMRDMFFSNKRDSLFILYHSKIFEVKYSNNQDENSIKKIDSSSLSDMIEHLFLKNKNYPSHITGHQNTLAIHNGVQKIMIYEFKSINTIMKSEIQVDENLAIHSIIFCEDDTKLFAHVSKAGFDYLICFTKNYNNNEWDQTSELLLPIEINGSWNMKYIHRKLVIVAWSRNLVIFS